VKAEAASAAGAVATKAATISALWTFPSILFSAFVIGWAAEAAQFLVSQGLALAILAFLGWKSKNNRLANGALFLLFLALTAGSRLFLEAFRGDSALVLGGIRSAQGLAWALLAAALVGLDRLERKHVP